MCGTEQHTLGKCSPDLLEDNSRYKAEKCLQTGGFPGGKGGTHSFNLQRSPTSVPQKQKYIFKLYLHLCTDYLFRNYYMYLKASVGLKSGQVNNYLQVRKLTQVRRPLKASHSHLRNSEKCYTICTCEKHQLQKKAVKPLESSDSEIFDQFELQRKPSKGSRAGAYSKGFVYSAYLQPKLTILMVSQLWGKNAFGLRSVIYKSAPVLKTSQLPAHSQN